jgi:hypothetical protein
MTDRDGSMIEFCAYTAVYVYTYAWKRTKIKLAYIILEKTPSFLSLIVNSMTLLLIYIIDELRRFGWYLECFRTNDVQL